MPTNCSHCSQFDQPKDVPLIGTERAPLLISETAIAKPTSFQEQADASESTAVADPAIRAAQLPLASIASEEVPNTAPVTVRLPDIANRQSPPAGLSLARQCRQCRATVGLRSAETYCAGCRLTRRFAALIEQRELSPTVWETLRRQLCLSVSIEKLSPDKARAVYQLLEIFVSRVSFAEQNVLTKRELCRRLTVLPDIPPVFVKLIERKPNNHAGHAETNNGATELTASAATGSDGGSAAHKENKSTAQGAKRHPVSAQRFLEVAVRQGSFCYWCGIRVIRVSEIPPTNRMHKNGGTILYYVGDELREEAVGTVDHLLRVSDGGSNSLVNLVISCYPCNQERDKITAAYGRAFARRRVPCRNCGGRFFHPDWGCCSICGAIPKRVGNNSSWFRRLAQIAKKLIAG